MKIEIILPDNAICGHLVYITKESGEDGKPAENYIYAGYLNEMEDGIQYSFANHASQNQAQKNRNQ